MSNAQCPWDLHPVERKRRGYWIRGHELADAVFVPDAELQPLWRPHMTDDRDPIAQAAMVLLKAHMAAKKKPAAERSPRETDLAHLGRNRLIRVGKGKYPLGGTAHD